MKGSIRKRGKDSWSLIIDIGRGPDDKRRQKWSTVKGTKKQAQAKLAETIGAIEKGAYVEPSRMTLAAYLDKWLAAIASNVSAKTHERYSGIVRVNIVPQIGGERLSDIRPLTIQGLYANLLTTVRRNGKGGLSARTVLHVHRLLHSAFRQAVKWEMLLRNPCEAVEPPKPEDREITVLDEAQAVQLIQRLSSTRLRVPVVLSLATGLRRGEFLALRWQNIDLNNATLRVNRTLEQTKGVLRFKSPKTRKSRRSVALPSFLVEMLRQHWKDQAERRLILGAAYQNQDLVFPREDGTPQTPDAFSTRFAEIVRSTNLPHVTLHGMRHTHATHLLLHGVHPKIVSERLGHSRIGLTLDTYSHLLPGMQESAAETFDAAMRAAMGKTD